MMKVNYLNSYFDYISRLDLGSGLYHYSDQEEEAMGWNKMNHFIYKKDDTTKWCVDYSGDKYYFFIQDGTLKRVDSEEFFLFANKETPEAVNWLLFNIDILRRK